MISEIPKYYGVHAAAALVLTVAVFLTWFQVSRRHPRHDHHHGDALTAFASSADPRRHRRAVDAWRRFYRGRFRAAALHDKADIFRAEALHTLSSPLWRFRWVVAFLGVFYVGKGARDLLLGFAADDRSHWTIPIHNARWLLIGHLSVAGPFLCLCYLQLVAIPWVAGDATLPRPEAAKRRATHRAVGYATVTAGLLAATSAGVLAFDALGDTVVIFLPWAAIWGFSAVMTALSARRKRWAAHRSWAKTLTQSAFAFIAGRVAIGLCLWLGLEEIRTTYYWSMVFSLVLVLMRVAADLKGWHVAIARQSRWKKLMTIFARARRRS